MGEVERQNVKFFAVHNHHLAVIPHQITGGARYGNSFRQEVRFQFAEIFFTPAICKSDQRVYERTSLHGVHHGFFNFGSIKAKEDNLNTLSGLLDAFDQAVNTVPGLNQ